jgi:hypothetical protein
MRRLAQTVRLRALLKPGCGLKFKPARDAAATPESAGSVSLSKCSVKDSARRLGANCPKPRLKSVAARPGSEHVLVVSSASLFFSSSLPLSVDFKLPVLPQSLPQQLTSGPRAQINRLPSPADLSIAPDALLKTGDTPLQLLSSSFVPRWMISASRGEY